jgi:hypothetical protein
VESLAVEFPSVGSAFVIAARVSGVALSAWPGRCQLASIHASVPAELAGRTGRLSQELHSRGAATLRQNKTATNDRSSHTDAEEFRFMEMVQPSKVSGNLAGFGAESERARCLSFVGSVFLVRWIELDFLVSSGESLHFNFGWKSVPKLPRT